MNLAVSVKPLHIDIPVKMTDVRTVYSIGALAFEGDLPASRRLQHTPKEP